MKLALAEELGRYQMTGYSDPEENPKNAREVIQCLTRDLMHIADRLDNEKAEECAEMICNSKRVFVVAAGNTIPVAMDFAFRLADRESTQAVERSLNMGWPLWWAAEKRIF